MYNVTKDISKSESSAHVNAARRTWCLKTGGWLDAGDEGVAELSLKWIWGAWSKGALAFVYKQ